MAEINRQWMTLQEGLKIKKKWKNTGWRFSIRWRSQEIQAETHTIVGTVYGLL